MKKWIILFSGYNQRAVIAFLRTLKKNRIENYSILASSKQDTILLTGYAEKVDYIRKNKELNYFELRSVIETIKKEKKAEEIQIMPSTEALNRFFFLYRKPFADINVYISLVNEHLYSIISDKATFYDLCKSYSLDVPKGVSFPSHYEFQFVAKPKKYTGIDGTALSPYIIDSNKAYDAFCHSQRIEDYFFQEFVTGESFYLLYYFSKNGEITKYSQINYAQQLNGKSILMAAPANIHNDPISFGYERLLNAISFTGLIMIELRKNRDSRYYMIEANPRFWGPSQLFVDANIPLFDRFLYDLGLVPEIDERNVNDNVRYFWSGGMKKSQYGDTSACAWHEGWEEDVNNHKELYEMFDIYDRGDTRGIYELERQEINETR